MPVTNGVVFNSLTLTNYRVFYVYLGLASACYLAVDLFVIGRSSRAVETYASDW